MRVAFVHHSYQVGNGTDTLVSKYAKGLVNKGHIVDIYTLKRSDLSLPVLDASRVTVTLLPFGNGRLNTSVFAPMYKRFWKVRQDLEKYDCVISMIYPSCLLPIWPSKLDTKVIHIEWGTPEGVWTTFGEKMYAKMAKISQGLACLRADKVLVPGDFVKRWVKENYGVEAKQMYLDGIDFPNYREDNNRYDTKNILYVGRVVPYKNLEALIKAVANIEGVTLTIVGNYNIFPKYTLKLIKLQGSLEVAKRIKLVGVVKDLEPYYLNCQVYCSPSKWEGFLKSDAYAYKKPMVALDLTSGRDIIQYGTTGLLCTAEAYLKSNLEYLLNEEEKCRKMGENGYKWARENLDMNKIVDNLEKEIVC